VVDPGWRLPQHKLASVMLLKLRCLGYLRETTARRSLPYGTPTHPNKGFLIPQNPPGSADPLLEVRGHASMSGRPFRTNLSIHAGDDPFRGPLAQVRRARGRSGALEKLISEIALPAAES
jgi:hypothetical protein